MGLGLDPLEHVLGFLARAQQDDSLHGIVPILVAEFAQARGDADDHAADVLDQHGSAVMHGEHHIADVLDRGQTSQAAHVVELAALGIESAAGIVVVGRERALDLCRGHADRGDPRRIEQYLVLHGAAAESGVVRHAGDGTVLRLDDPILEGLQFHRASGRGFAARSDK